MCRVTHLIVFCHSLNFILSSKSFGHWTSKPPKSDGTEREKAPYLNIAKECVELTRKTAAPTNALYLEEFVSAEDKCYRLKIGSGVRLVGLSNTDMMEQGWDIRGLLYEAETGTLHDGFYPLITIGPPLRTGDDIEIRRRMKNGSLVVEFARDNRYLGKAFQIGNNEKVAFYKFSALSFQI